MSLTDDRRWSQIHEFHFAQVLRARAMLSKQVMSLTCVVRYSSRTYECGKGKKALNYKRLRLNESQSGLAQV